MRGSPRSLRRSGLAILLAVLLPLVAACGTAEPPTTAANTTAAATPQAPATIAPAVTEPAATAETSTAAAAATEPAATEPAATEPAATEATATAPAATEPAATETLTAAEATAPAEPAPTEAAGGAPRPKFGVVAHLYYTDRERVVQLVENGGFEWIRQQVPWKDTEKQDRTFGFQELDQIVASVNARNKRLLLSITAAPDFLTGRPGDNGMPRDPKDFARFAEALLKQYPGQIHAIEVWNEQNLAVENGGRVVPEDAGRYVEMLKEAYKAIKAIDPSVIVVAGALSSTGVTQPDIAVDDITYLKAMYAYNNGEIRDYFDVQGFHPASAANPPETKFPEDPGTAPGWNNHPTHFFRHIEDVRQVMVDSGLGDKKVWITEMGWATENNTPGYEYGQYVSLEQQGEYLEGALFRTVFQYGEWVDAVFIWNLNFAVTWGEVGNPLHEQASFGILNPDWSPRPAYTRIQGFIAAVKGNEQP